MKWISIEDELPDKEVICGNFKQYTYGYGEMIIGWYSSKLHYAENEVQILENVTHWMPLPEPPEDK